MFLRIFQCVTIATAIVSGALGEGSHGETGLINDSPQARMLFNLSDFDQNALLTRLEFHEVFLDFDNDTDGNVTRTEFMSHWDVRQLGPHDEGTRLFNNLDVNNDHKIDEEIDLPHIFRFFDRNGDDHVNEGEFVIQWVKIAS